MTETVKGRFTNCRNTQLFINVEVLLIKGAEVVAEACSSQTHEF